MILECLLNKDTSNIEILESLAKIFNISIQNIFLTEDVYSLNISLEENIEILCETSEIHEDFVNHITIYLRSKNLKNISCKKEDFFIELSHYLNCDCLI